MFRLSPRYVIAAVLFGTTAPVTLAQDKKDDDKKDAKTFTRHLHKDKDGEMYYWVFVPDKRLKGPHPTILFMHGWSEKAKPTSPPTGSGIGRYVEKHKETFPFIVVCPRADSPKGGPNGWDGVNRERALAILDEVLKKHDGDPKRQYLTGLSMGGAGVWHAAAAEPDRWAAIAPVCGWTDTKDAAKLKDMPIWCFHGAKDNVIEVKESRDMIAAITKLAPKGNKPKYTEYPNAGHNCWDDAYNTDGLYKWLLEQKLEPRK